MQAMLTFVAGENGWIWVKHEASEVNFNSFFLSKLGIINSKKNY